MKASDRWARTMKRRLERAGYKLILQMLRSPSRARRQHADAIPGFWPRVGSGRCNSRKGTRCSVAALRVLVFWTMAALGAGDGGSPAERTVFGLPEPAKGL